MNIYIVVIPFVLILITKGLFSYFVALLIIFIKVHKSSQSLLELMI